MTEDKVEKETGRREVIEPADMETQKDTVGALNVVADMIVNKDTVSKGEERRLTVPEDMEANKRCKRSGEEEKDYVRLLPGIPDDVTFCIIAPKLFWRDIQTSLPSVSLAWQQAIRSHEIYKARIRTHSTGTLAVIRHYHPGNKSGISDVPVYHDEDIEALSLYSIGGKCWYDLPPIPFSGGIPPASGCIALDSKIYILGGLRGPMSDTASKEVYALDLAGPLKWKQCASMLEPRYSFGSGILYGKIYVFGGCSSGEPFFGCEVYDPKADAWSQICSMGEYRINHQVGLMGEKLIVYGGQYATSFHLPQVLEAHHPIKNVWTQIKPSQEGFCDKVFMAQGQFHKMTPNSITVYDIEKDLWSHVQSFGSAPKEFMTGRFGVGPEYSMAIGDGLLFAKRFSKQRGIPGLSLYQCKGFSSKKIPILWERVNWALKFYSRKSPFICAIEL